MPDDALISREEMIQDIENMYEELDQDGHHDASAGIFEAIMDLVDPFKALRNQATDEQVEQIWEGAQHEILYKDRYFGDPVGEDNFEE